MSLSKGLEFLKISALKVVPSFLANAIIQKRESDDPNVRSPQKHRNSGLDGLRGIAALCVVNLHTLYAFDDNLFFGPNLSFQDAQSCGAIQSESEYHSRSELIQMPVIRLVVSGGGAVSIFFVISGLVLTQRLVRLAREHEWDELIKALSSSAFRRPIRLFLPISIAMFLKMLLVQVGAMDRGLDDPACLIHASEPAQERFSSFFAALVDFFLVFWSMLDIWDWRIIMPPYDKHLWTIPVEFRCSMFIFLTTLTLSRFRVRVRLSILPFLIVYSYLRFRWDATLFLIGLAFAETSLIYQRHLDLPKSDSGDTGGLVSLMRKWAPTIVRTALLLLSLYLLSTPLACLEHSPGFSYLAAWPIKPFQTGPLQFHQSIGASILVGLVSHSPPNSILIRLFSSSVPQYLGRISYSLYILHGPLLHLFGYRVFLAVWKGMGSDTRTSFFFGGLISYLIVLFVVIWIADLFCRGIDERSISLAHRIAVKARSKKVRIALP